MIYMLIFIYLNFIYKKFSYRREAARCFLSLNILLSHSRSFKVIENGAIFVSLGFVLYSHSIETMAQYLAVSTRYTNVTDTQSARHRIPHDGRH